MSERTKRIQTCWSVFLSRCRQAGSDVFRDRRTWSVSQTESLSLSLTCCHHQKSLSRWRRPEEDERRISAFSSPLIWLFLCQNRPFLRVQSSSQPFYTVAMEGNWKHLIQPAESCRSSNSVFISSVTSLLSFSLILWKWNCIDPRAEIGSSQQEEGPGCRRE